MVYGFANTMLFPVMLRNVGIPLVTDLAYLLQFLVDTPNMRLQIAYAEVLATVRAHDTLVVVHSANMSPQV